MNRIKQAYWRWLNRRHPAHTVLTPHDALGAIAERLSERSGPITVIDGGAHDGVVARQMAEQFGDVRLHAFEPNTDLLPALQQSLKGVPGSINTCALAERSGPMTLHVNNSPMTSSLLHRGELAERYFDDVTRPVGERTIDAVSIDDFCIRRGIERVDVLKLDLQGYELHALRGARETLMRGVGCVYTEVSFGEVYRGGAVFGEIDALMRDAGYELVNLYHLSTRNADGRLLGGDALYVPRRVTGELKLRRVA